MRYLLRRLLGLIPTFLGITVICFAVIHLAPGEPTALQAELNPNITAQSIERLKTHYGLDKPLKTILTFSFDGTSLARAGFPAENSKLFPVSLQ